MCDHRCGPRLHAHPPLPAPPSHLTLYHSRDAIVTDHPRCAIVAEAAPASHTPVPTTTIPGVGWRWVRMVRGDAEVRTYTCMSSHCTLPPALTYRDPAPAPAPPCATAVIAPPPPTVLLSPSPMTGHNPPAPAPQPHTVRPPIVVPYCLPQVSPTTHPIHLEPM